MAIYARSGGPNSMKSTHTLITLIIASMLSVLFGIGYFNLITPNENQAKLYDKQRESDFSKISDAIQTYQSTNDELPESLKALSEAKKSGSSAGGSALDSILVSFSALGVRDPQTNARYTYSYDDQKKAKYKLCADFATDNKDDKSDGNGSKYYDQTTSTVKHGKGKNVCVDFSVNQQKIGNNSSSLDDIGVNSVVPAGTSSQARDVQRKSNLHDIRSALEIYYSDTSMYPTNLSQLTSGSTPYLKSLPKDPSSGASYSYTALPAGSSLPTSYLLSAKLENSKDKDIKTGTNSLYELTNAQ